MREGDIYRWKWSDPERDNRGMFGDYHCKSMMAVFENGRLYDTFWASSPTDGSFLDPKQVELTLIGNRNDLEVFSDREDFYDPSDLIIMRHSNDTSAKTLMKPGAKRSAGHMRNALKQKADDAEQRMRSAIWDLKRLAVAENAIERGEIDKLYF